MSDDWIKVTGRRSFKQKYNRKNDKNNNKENELDPYESKLNQNFEKVKKEIKNVYDNSKPFLSNILSGIKRTLRSENVYLYALGCGTLENISLVLAKSCLYQWAVCIIIIKLFKIPNVYIYDPVMTKNDYLVWNKLIKHNYDFKDNMNLLDDFNSPSTSSTSHVLLWMPHCEKFLYKAVLEGLLDNKSPLEVSKLLSDNSQHNIDHSDSNTNSHHAEFFSLDYTTLVGNSLSEYTLDDLCFKDHFTLIESSLLPFDIHNQSFNDTYITTFKSNS